MANQYLLMKYHPAKKEVEFRRFQGEVEIPIRSDSRLKPYMNGKGKFILQDHGDSFFDDIAKAFDGETSVDLKVNTTKNDYEDFEQMVEYYNENPNHKCKINATLLAELPDMKSAFETVKEYGKESIAILELNKTKILDLKTDTESVKEVAKGIVEEIESEISNIKEKIKVLGDNNINLCFTGVYSAGKSALINALLGYRILPEKIKSETAKMFKIQSPKNGMPVAIKFLLTGVTTSIVWNEKEYFEFAEGPNENAKRSDIQNKLNELKDKRLHEQLCEILKMLNALDSVSVEIDVLFPIPLDNNNLNFIIFDTPGSDSNYKEHQVVLEDALSNQTQSILVFVAQPTKMEGEGNSALLNYLKTAEEKDSKTSIDINRSLFVINWADTLNNESRKALQTQDIKFKKESTDSDENGSEQIDFSIKLSDKKLFFASAMYGYSSAAMKNNIATDEEKYYCNDDTTMTNPFKGNCFRQNKFATSEFATKAMIERSETALAKAKEANDKVMETWVASGLYALEDEISRYGEKFASATKTYAIINSVEKALNKINQQNKSCTTKNDESIEKIEKDIKEIRNIISCSIEDAKNEYAIPTNEAFPVALLKRLHLDSEYLTLNLTGEVKNYINDHLKRWFLGLLGKYRPNEKQKNAIINYANSVLEQYKDDFITERGKSLNENGLKFMSLVKEAIVQNGDISEEAKSYVLAIPAPENWSSARSNEEIETIWTDCTTSENFLWFDSYLDKDEFINSVGKVMSEIVNDLAEKFKEEYRLSLNAVIDKVKVEFEGNLEKYSVRLQALQKDKKSMEILKQKLTELEGTLKNRQAELEKTIWQEV